MNAVNAFADLLREIGEIDRLEVSVADDKSVSIVAIQGHTRRCCLVVAGGEPDGTVYDYRKPLEDSYYHYAPEWMHPRGWVRHSHEQEAAS